MTEKKNFIVHNPYLAQSSNTDALSGKGWSHKMQKCIPIIVKTINCDHQQQNKKVLSCSTVERDSSMFILKYCVHLQDIEGWMKLSVDIYSQDNHSIDVQLM